MSKDKLLSKEKRSSKDDDVKKKMNETDKKWFTCFFLGHICYLVYPILDLVYKRFQKHKNRPFGRFLLSRDSLRENSFRQPIQLEEVEEERICLEVVSWKVEVEDKVVTACSIIPAECFK